MFYPIPTLLTTVYELNNVKQTIVYTEAVYPTRGATGTEVYSGATGIGASTGGIDYPVTITTTMPNSTITVSGNTIVGEYTNVFHNEISYRTKDNKFVTVQSWADIIKAIGDETLADLYHFKPDPRQQVVYTYEAHANGHTQTYTINVNNDWLTGRNRLIKYANLTRYQQKILVEWINNNTGKVAWFNNVLDNIDNENTVLGATGL
jgi:hypothetical protein